VSASPNLFWDGTLLGFSPHSLSLPLLGPGRNWYLYTCFFSQDLNFRAGAAQWERTLWKKLEVGDIVLLRDNEQVRATASFILKATQLER
jgi:hypothetical protein